MQFTLRGKATSKVLGVVLMIILLSGCGNTPYRRKVNWLYIVPDQYEGWLVIQYDCAGGIPLEEKGNTIQVEFDSDGQFCTTDSFFPWTGRLYAQNVDGNPIPEYGTLIPETGYAVCCGGVMSQRYSREGQSIQEVIQYRWVGNMEKGRPDYSTLFRE